MRKDSNPKPLFPVWGCDCGDPNALLVSGPLEYNMNAPNQYSIAKPHCSGCNGFGSIREFHLPAEFTVRIAGCQADYGDVVASK